MYNTTLRCVRTTIVIVEHLYVLHILSVFIALGIQRAIRLHLRLNIVCVLSLHNLCML